MFIMHSDYSVFSVCCTQRELYSVMTTDHGTEGRERYLNFVFVGGCRAEGRIERDDMVWGKS